MAWWESLADVWQWYSMNRDDLTPIGALLGGAVVASLGVDARPVLEQFGDDGGAASTQNSPVQRSFRAPVYFVRIGP